MLSANRNIEMCIKNPIYYIIYIFNNLIIIDYSLHVLLKTHK